MPTIKSLCDPVGITIMDLVREAGLAYETAKKILDNEPVARRSIVKALSYINRELGTSHTPETVSANQL